LDSVVLVNILSLCAAGAALAGDTKPRPEPTHTGVPVSVGRPISWEELKDRCAHPEQFDVQRAPQNILLRCEDRRLIWQAAPSGEVALPGSRQVASGVFTDKFYVEAQRREVLVAGKSGSCHRFKEVEETLVVERPLSCDEVLGIKGDLTEFCASLTEATKGNNPKAVEWKDTQRVIDTCGAIQNEKPTPK
jgi:hypothetical protein